MNKNQKIFGVITVLLIVGSTIAGILISNKENNSPLIKEELVSYFREIASRKSVRSVGQPIEEISPPMFLEVFPNLREIDLDGVQTALGYYRYENNQIVYKENDPQTPSTTYTITEEGFETMLDNLARRFDTELESKNSVNKIIDKLYEESLDNKKLNFRNISKDSYNLLTTKSENVITTQEEWMNFWESVSPNDGPVPQIDFDKKMVIAVLMGQKSTGGYSIEITNVIEQENDVIVKIKEISPGPNCGADAVLTSPYHIIEVSKSVMPVVNFITAQEITQFLPEK